MRQCPDCEVKDRVVIAGKVFCANCGTPWQPADPNEAEQYAKEVESSKESTAPAAPPSSSPSTETPAPQETPNASSKVEIPATIPVPPPEKSLTPTVTETSKSVIAESAPEIPSEPTKSPEPIKPVTTPDNVKVEVPKPVIPEVIASPLGDIVAPASAQEAVKTDSISATNNNQTNNSVPAVPDSFGANVIIKKTADRLADHASIDKNSSINKFHQPATQISQRNQSNLPNEQATESVKSTLDSTTPVKSNTAESVIEKINQVPISVAPAVPTPTASPSSTPAPESSENKPNTEIKTEDLTANIGSELTDISSKNETIMSDSQFNELSKLDNKPTDIKPPTDSVTAPIDQSKTSPALQTNTSSEGTESAIITQTQPQQTSSVAPSAAIAPAPSVESTPVNPSSVPVSVATTAGAANVSKVMTDVVRTPKAIPASTPPNPLSSLASSPPTPTTPVVPVAAPVVDNTFKPTGSAALNLTQPASSVQPTAPMSPPSANDTTTVAGLTMSKEAAMKLALDSDSTGKSGEESVGKAFKPSSVALTLVGLLLIGAYIWQVNYPNLALKVAGNRANLAVSLPSYMPSGWKLTGPIQSRPGEVSYNLADEKKDREVAITTAKSEWDSQALADNFVATKSNSYLALQSQGLTVYVYGKNQASWVNSGKWYRIEGDSSGLSQDQIIKIATSI